MGLGTAQATRETPVTDLAHAETAGASLPRVEDRGLAQRMQANLVTYALAATTFANALISPVSAEAAQARGVPSTDKPGVSERGERGERRDSVRHEAESVTNAPTSANFVASRPIIVPSGAVRAQNSAQFDDDGNNGSGKNSTVGKSKPVLEAPGQANQAAQPQAASPITYAPRALELQEVPEAPAVFEAQEAADEVEALTDENQPMAAMAAGAALEVLGEEVVQDTIGLERLMPNQAMNSFMVDPLAVDYGVFATPLNFSYKAPDGSDLVPDGTAVVTFLSRIQVEIDLRGLRTTDPKIIQNAHFSVMGFDPGYGAGHGRSSPRHFIPIDFPEIGPEYLFAGEDWVTGQSFPIIGSIVKNPAFPSSTRHIVSLTFPEAALGNAPTLLPGGAVPLSITPVKGPLPSGFVAHHMLGQSPDPLATPAHTYQPNSTGRPFENMVPGAAGLELLASYVVVHAREKAPIITEIPFLELPKVIGGKFVAFTAAGPGEVFLETCTDLKLNNWVKLSATSTPDGSGTLRWEFPASGNAGFVRAFTRE